MTPEQHIQKATRITQALSKLTLSDYEMVIESTMLAGSHWVNAALHRCGVTYYDEDAMHVEYLPLATRTKISLIIPGLLEGIEQIEQYRPMYVRGNAEGGEPVARRCIQLLDGLQKVAYTAERVRGLSTYSISPKGVVRAPA